MIFVIFNLKLVKYIYCNSKISDSVGDAVTEEGEVALEGVIWEDGLQDVGERDGLPERRAAAAFEEAELLCDGDDVRVQRHD